MTCPPASPHFSNDNKVVQKYQSVFHRLRLSALPQGPTNPGRTNLPQETLGLRRTGFSPVFSLLMSAQSLVYSPASVTLDLQPVYNAPLPRPSKRRTSAASADSFSPVHFRRETTRLVSYYALFKWWLPLSQHPGCLCSSTSFKPLSTDQGPQLAVWAVSLSTMKLIPHSLTPEIQNHGIRSLIVVGTPVRAREQSVLYPRALIKLKASPQAISKRTSYHRV
eukprot:TRINITY_DN21_c0_g1_i19.p2 TRINITY_DN21_c0_g1~~TRINITY_DN21_c0_g1_i19.p2  ORF type:complete len:222 (+),score=-30.48 TRINITY_DN21_c0_g1_i19:1463-2128(+)